MDIIIKSLINNRLRSIFPRRIVIVLSIFIGTILFLRIPQTYAQGAKSIWMQERFSQKSSLEMRVGEEAEIEIWVDLTGEPTTGCAFYMTMNPKFLEIYDYNPDPREEYFDPFDFTDGFWGSNFIANGKLGIDWPDKLQINGEVLSTPSIRSGRGRVCTFKIKAVDVTQKTEITIDHDVIGLRDTRYIHQDAQPRRFSSRGSLIVNIKGIGLEGIPDIFLKSGEVDNSIILSDYLINPPANIATLEWNAEGGNGNVFVNINNATSQATITAREDFAGQETIIFRVTDVYNKTGEDTIFVTVSDSPNFIGFPSIVFNEDDEWLSLPLHNYVNDDDTPSEDIIWEARLDTASMQDTSIIQVSIIDTVNAKQDFIRRMRVTSKKNYFGNDGAIWVYVTDKWGATDSLRVVVRVVPVNDAPHIYRKIPDITFTPLVPDTSIFLDNYVEDVDNDFDELFWTFTGNDSIKISIDPTMGHRIKFTASTGFLGKETIVFKVEDPFKKSDRDTITVTTILAPPKSSIPDTVFLVSTDSLVHNFVDLDTCVVDPDDPSSSIIWVVEGDSLTDTRIGTDNLVTFHLTTHNDWGIEKQIFTAEDPAKNIVRDTVVVIILSNGIPTVGLIPDIIIEAGGSDSSIFLDNHVWDLDTPRNQITWLGLSEDEKVTVDINPETHRVIVSSPDPEFLGQVVVTFRATDPEEHYREQSITVSVVAFGRPFLKDIPNVSLTKFRSKKITLNDFLIIYPDSLIDPRYISWNVEPSNANINISINQVTSEATFELINEDFIGSKKYTFTVTNLENDESASDEVIVNVSLGKPPVVGYISDIMFTSGEKDSSIHLNRYVRDEDTIDDSIRWEVRGNNQVTVDESRLVKGEDHVLVLGNKQGFTGQEQLIITAIDPEGNDTADTINVTVVTFTALEIAVFPNPVHGEFIDFVIYSLEPLTEKPTFKVKFNEETEHIPLTKIENVYAYKGDYVFEQSAVGTALFFANALDRFSRIVADTVKITHESLSKTSELNVSHNNGFLSLPKGSVDENTGIVIFQEDYNTMLRQKNREEKYTLNSGSLEFVQGFYMGPSEIPLIVPGIFSYEMDCESGFSKDLEKIGLYNGDYITGNWDFLGKK